MLNVKSCLYSFATELNVVKVLRNDNVLKWHESTYSMQFIPYTHLDYNILLYIENLETTDLTFCCHIILKLVRLVFVYYPSRPMFYVLQGTL
jgi:hypothetical protein